MKPPRGFRVKGERVEDGCLILDVEITRWRMRWELLKAIWRAF